MEWETTILLWASLSIFHLLLPTQYLVLPSTLHNTLKTRFC